MSVQLLDKTRKINKLLHNNTSKVFVFNDICRVLSDVLESNVLVFSKKGKILGLGEYYVAETDTMWKDAEVGKFINEDLNERLLNILSTKENVHLETLGFEGEVLKEHHVIVTPSISPESGWERCLYTRIRFPMRSMTLFWPSTATPWWGWRCFAR